MESIKDIIGSIKKEITEETNLVKEAEQKDDVSVDLSDLNLDFSLNEETEKIEKVASSLDNISTLEELIKTAEEAGHMDLANLTKIADFMADKIAEKIVKQLQKD